MQAAERIKDGWRGRFFEDFNVGDIYKHTLGRTVTATDNAWFTLLTQNTAPLHFDANYASHIGIGDPAIQYHDLDGQADVERVAVIRAIRAKEALSGKY